MPIDRSFDFGQQAHCLVPSQGVRMMRSIRYQGAIIQEHHVLLLKQWSMPVGAAIGRFQAAASRRVRRRSSGPARDTGGDGLSVQVDSLLLDEPSTLGAIYQRWKTYRCSILAGEVRPGAEPEAVYVDAHSFTEVGWFDLRHPTTWNGRLEGDSFMYSWLQRVQGALGYAVAPWLQDRTQELL